MSPLAALTKRYYLELEWLQDMPRLGRPYAVRGDFKAAIFPRPEIHDMNSRTTFPNILCLDVFDGEKKSIHPLSGPHTQEKMRQIARYLIDLGAHPLDLIVATWDHKTDEFTFRKGVEHLLWTAPDQDRIDAEDAA